MSPLRKHLGVDGVCSDWFEVLGGVPRRCVLGSIDWVIKRTLERSSLGVHIGRQTFTGID